MRSSSFRRPWIVPVLALAAAGFAASAKAGEASLDDADLGKPVSGPVVTVEDFRGKAVVFEYWGDRCPPCLKAIPHLCDVQKKYGREKLVVVANQVWTKEVETAKTAFESKAPKDYQVSVINHGDLKGAKMKGVPHAFVFNADGTLRWHGHPAADDFDKVVEEAVATQKK